MSAPIKRPDVPFESFQPFQWHTGGPELVPAGGVLELIGQVRDVAQGCRTLAELIAWDDDAASERGKDEEGRPILLLDPYTRGALQRLTITALDLLDAEAQRVGERADAKAKGGAQ